MDITAPLPPGTADDPASFAAAAHALLDPSGLGPVDRVPLIPEAARRRHYVFVPADHRFKAAARFLQALWREDRGLAMGTHVDRREPHRLRRLGSRISTAAGALAANFLHPDIVPVVARALAYREPGAAYDIDRLKTNLLSSQPLAFNLFGLLTGNPTLTTRFVNELLPGTMTHVTDILFEHSPGRGDPRFTADRTAYDVVLRGRDATGARALLCIEIKYSEGGHEPAPPPHPRHAEIARTTPGLFVDPANPTLTGHACQQLYRQHCLASAMLTAGLADTATLAFIAPTHNQLAHAAATTYTRQLTDPQGGPIPFIPLTLEHAFAALASAGLPNHARALHRRYTDWWLVDGELDLAAAPPPHPRSPRPPPRHRPQGPRPTHQRPRGYRPGGGGPTRPGPSSSESPAPPDTTPPPRFARPDHADDRTLLHPRRGRRPRRGLHDQPAAATAHVVPMYGPLRSGKAPSPTRPGARQPAQHNT